MLTLVNHQNATIVVAPYLHLVIKANYSHMVTHFLECWSLGIMSHTAYRDRICKFPQVCLWECGNLGHSFFDPLGPRQCILPVGVTAPYDIG